MNKIIKDIKDYCEHFETDEKHLERDTYKYTDCGAYIFWNESSVTIGSIVEGSDAEFSKKFVFPCTAEEIDKWFDELEKLTDEAWHEAND